MCDQLVNSCGADATAKATCASAAAAADTATAKTGAQADKFNAVFGIQTNFAAVPVVSDQGVTLGVGEYLCTYFLSIPTGSDFVAHFLRALAPLLLYTRETNKYRQMVQVLLLQLLLPP